MLCIDFHEFNQQPKKWANIKNENAQFTLNFVRTVFFFRPFGDSGSIYAPKSDVTKLFPLDVNREIKSEGISSCKEESSNCQKHQGINKRWGKTKPFLSDLGVELESHSKCYYTQPFLKNVIINEHLLNCFQHLFYSFQQFFCEGL